MNREESLLLSTEKPRELYLSALRFCVCAEGDLLSVVRGAKKPLPIFMLKTGSRKSGGCYIIIVYHSELKARKKCC